MESNKLSRTERNLWSAFLDEAMATQKYAAFAMKAMEEGHPEVAEIFQEVAGAETIHAISQLRVAGEVRSTLENLQRVIEEEAYEFDTMYPRRIQEAEAEGRTDAAHVFRLALGREIHHHRMFQEALEGLGKKLGQPIGAALPPQRPTPRPPQGVPTLASASEIPGEMSRIAALARIREVIFGAQDGLISNVALVSSITGAVTQNHIILIAGLAGAFAGMISMGSGTYLGSQATRELHLAEIAREARELEENPAEELAELVEIYRREGMSYDDAVATAERIASDKDLWLRTLAEKELGLNPELPESPRKNAVAMGVSFLFGALVPVLPYFLLPAQTALIPSLLVTVTVLFAVGALKARVVHKSPITSGLQVMAIGSAAGVLGYLLGDVIPRFLGVSL